MTVGTTLLLKLLNIYTGNLSLAFDRSSNRVYIWVYDFEEDLKLKYNVAKGSEFMPEKFFVHSGLVAMVWPRWCGRGVNVINGFPCFSIPRETKKGNSINRRNFSLTAFPSSGSISPSSVKTSFANRSGVKAIKLLN